MMKTAFRRSFALRAALILVLGGFVAALRTAAQAQDTVALSTLQSFAGTAISDQASTLTRGSDGNFYGTTSTGGDNNTGTVFKLAPDGTVTTLYSFAFTNGSSSLTALTEGSDGDFYGASYNGGVNGYGMVYKITSGGVFTDLHDFTDGTDGSGPYAALTASRNGNLYGTNWGGGNPYSTGVVFTISPTGEFTVLHRFDGSDGGFPDAPLVEASDGNFYGTTDGAYDGSAGTIYRISTTGVFADLYHFGTSDGAATRAALVEGSDGNFYGTSRGFSGTSSDGVYRVTPSGVFTILHTFTGGLDGSSPSGLVPGADGNFYGATSEGGIYGRDAGFPRPPARGYGTIFQITPAGVFTILYNFTGGSDGSNPVDLVPDGSGGFYGETSETGGATGGTLFKLTVSSHPSFFAGQESFGNGFYYLQFPNGNFFGYYGFLDDPNYLYHTDLGYEYVFDAADGKNGVYLYDFASGGFFYTSPTFPFPYLYDFKLQAVLYYYPDTTRAGHFTTNPRYFYNFATGQIIAK